MKIKCFPQSLVEWHEVGKRTLLGGLMISLIGVCNLMHMTHSNGVRPSIQDFDFLMITPILSSLLILSYTSQIILGLELVKRKRIWKDFPEKCMIFELKIISYLHPFIFTLVFLVSILEGNTIIFSFLLTMFQMFAVLNLGAIILFYLWWLSRRRLNTVTP